ncbi:MAG: hypothetical protein CVU05_12155 [Bacteroidetes bacterium HGW-Bacteroidetes-21]|jgi:hypothetical protein|nr:MAG: hypothetical protein CVU05_12155 [Bacteroidetes bacterium HGW-Bacteroidetes-21]
MAVFSLTINTENVQIKGALNPNKKRFKNQKMLINVIIIYFTLLNISNSSLCYSQKYKREKLIEFVNTKVITIDSLEILKEVLIEFKDDVNAFNKMSSNDTLYKSTDNSSGIEVSVTLSTDELIMWSVICFIETVYFNKKPEDGTFFVHIKNKCKNAHVFEPNFIELNNLYCLVSGEVIEGNDSYDYMKKINFNKKVVLKVYHKYYNQLIKQVLENNALNKKKHPLNNTKYEILQLKVK